MGSGQSVVDPPQHSLVLQFESEEQKEREENKHGNSDSKKSRQKNQNKANKPLTNKHGDKLPGEGEDDYTEFFDNVEEPFADVKDEDAIKDDGFDRISVPEDELKEIMEQVDQEIIVEESMEISKLESKTVSLNLKPQNKIQLKPMKMPKSPKLVPKFAPATRLVSTDNKKRNSNPVDINYDSWSYDEESIEGFDLEKFKKANVTLKNMKNKEANNYEYKVYNVDPYSINSSTIHSGFDSDINNSGFGEKSKGPKFDFVDERLMSQIESEYS